MGCGAGVFILLFCFSSPLEFRITLTLMIGPLRPRRGGDQVPEGDGQDVNRPVVSRSRLPSFFPFLRRHFARLLPVHQSRLSERGQLDTHKVITVALELCRGETAVSFCPPLRDEEAISRMSENGRANDERVF